MLFMTPNGFGKGLSTVDAVFILMNVFQTCLSKNNRLYCAFVDMCKCFDTLYRDGLWLKLFKCGIQGKILRIIKDMYQKVKSCVVVNIQIFSNTSDNGR